ncbi:MAG TPA: outer membrane lipoprotein carrier protein LolA [Sphingomonas sp.]|jgi:outer membrane lipoprotein-sorting protein|nr:outer membrane lipoprotein carrier protein LolA [Sphingomonas sp.]
MISKYLLPLAVIAAPALAQESDLALVQSHLRGVQTMTAGFAQTDRAGKTLTGTLTLKRPGRIRFQYGNSVPILVVADGKSLWFIDYSVRQVSRWPIGGSPLAVLLDPNADISRYAKIIPSSDPRVVLALVKDPKRPQFGAITLAFAREATAPGGLRMQGWVALDAQNNRTTVVLSNQRFNAAIDDGAFKWRDPRQAGPRK